MRSTPACAPSTPRPGRLTRCSASASFSHRAMLLPVVAAMEVRFFVCFFSAVGVVGVVQPRGTARSVELGSEAAPAKRGTRSTPRSGRGRGARCASEPSATSVAVVAGAVGGAAGVWWFFVSNSFLRPSRWMLLPLSFERESVCSHSLRSSHSSPLLERRALVLLTFSHSFLLFSF